MENFEAAFYGIKEIAFSVMAISSMLLAVFIPVAFMGGVITSYSIHYTKLYERSAR